LSKYTSEPLLASADVSVVKVCATTSAIPKPNKEVTDFTSIGDWFKIDSYSFKTVEAEASRRTRLFLFSLVVVDENDFHFASFPKEEKGHERDWIIIFVIIIAQLITTASEVSRIATCLARYPLKSLVTLLK
tara:strand:- start:17 stop:412 length:396 start_codon:yes stop_codon:yes gene_type:complete